MNQNASLLTNVLQRKTNTNAFKKYEKQKKVKNDTEYEKYLVTDEVLSFFNIFEVGENILN